MNDEGGRLPPRGRLHASAFWRAFLGATGFFAVLGLISMAGAMRPGLYWAWFIAVIAWWGTIILVIFDRRAFGSEEAASGVVAGLALAAILLMTSCFANFATAVDLGPPDYLRTTPTPVR